MKTLYIFDDKQLSSNCGIGTYIRDLSKLVVEQDDMQLCMIMFNTDIEKCRIFTCNGIDYILFPKNVCSNPFEDARIICGQLRQYILDPANSLFLFNYSPCEKLISNIGVFFPKAKRICVVHDFNWTNIFLGDVLSFQNNVLKKSVPISPINEEIRAIYECEKNQFHQVDIVICLSEDSEEILRKNYQIPQDNIRLIPHGIEIKKRLLSKQKKQELRQSYGIGVDETIFLSVGRISKAKGSFACLNAFKKFLNINSQCKWVIVGGLSRMLNDLLLQAGTAITKIIVTGFLNENELSDWYEMADVGIISSYTEQCSYVGLEMMNNGLPIVASDGLGVKCMFHDDINANVAHIYNIDTPQIYEWNLVNCMLDVCQMKKTKKKELRKKTLNLLNEKYSYQKMKEKYRILFSEI